MRSNLSLQVKATDILAECDKLRDITLPDLGVRLEDKEGEKTVIKLVDKEELRKEREEKLALEEKKRLEKEAKKAKAAAEAAKALEEAKIPPEEMFRKETDKYSAWDDKGVPTHLADGKEVPKVQKCLSINFLTLSFDLKKPSTTDLQPPRTLLARSHQLTLTSQNCEHRRGTSCGTGTISFSAEEKLAGFKGSQSRCCGLPLSLDYEKI